MSLILSAKEKEARAKKMRTLSKAKRGAAIAAHSNVIDGRQRFEKKARRKYLITLHPLP